MNQTTRYVMDIYQVAVIIRDTLEYAIQKKDGYRLDIYNQRKTILETAMNPNHALSKFLAENKEAGEKIKNNIKDFYDLVYGEESRAVFVENDKVVVDNGYTSQILDYVVGLHETVYDILKGFINYAKTNNVYEEELGNLVAKENAYYRSVVSMVVTDEMHKLFVEFNKAMHESKGQQTPQSNFIANDLKKTIGFFRFVEEHADLDDSHYKAAVEKTKFVVDCMGGAQKIDDTGEGLRREIMNLHDLWYRNVSLTEAEWKDVYTAEVQALVNFDKEMAAAREANKVEETPKTEEEKLN